MIAGFQEQKVGNNFGYSAFVSYGAFWIGLSIIYIMNHLDVYTTTHLDKAFFMTAWTLYTVIMFIASFRVNRAMTVTFALLLLGFIGLDFAYFGMECVRPYASVVLICCAFSAWYMMAAIIINDLAGKTVLPLGTPWAKRAN